MTKDSPATHLNLDTLEREDAPEPFAFVLGGDRFVCADPQELDYRAFREVGDTDIEGQFRVLLDPDKFTAFGTKKLPLWKMKRLNRDVLEHYGLGNTNASATS